ncbi:MAG: hypothetical protein KF781_11525 [Chitinophagaceae bacterium]|nr:hypothetical protein [Chitinophagaceae bacterium]MCW5905821.1 hypothetical protein [Chitinophagaceae bacterium]
MKNKRKIKVEGYLLLLLYFIGISPSFLVHQHDNDIVPFLQATQCEKVIYYHAEPSSCKHNEHFTKVHKTCWLCEHISISPQIITDTNIDVGLTPAFIEKHILLYTNLQSVELPHTSNRGPPFA